MAKLNKAEKFVKRVMQEKFGFYIKRNLSYDRDRAWNEVYGAIRTKLNNPESMPPEYSAALANFENLV